MTLTKRKVIRQQLIINNFQEFKTSWKDGYFVSKANSVFLLNKKQFFLDIVQWKKKFSIILKYCKKVSVIYYNAKFQVLSQIRRKSNNSNNTIYTHVSLEGFFLLLNKTLKRNGTFHQKSFSRLLVTQQLRVRLINSFNIFN